MGYWKKHKGPLYFVSIPPSAVYQLYLEVDSQEVEVFTQECSNTAHIIQWRLNFIYCRKQGLSKQAPSFLLVKLFIHLILTSSSKLSWYEEKLFKSLIFKHLLFFFFNSRKESASRQTSANASWFHNFI